MWQQEFGPGTAVVTGAASGIGAAVRELLISRGWNVVGFDLFGDASQDIDSVDVADPQDVSDAVERVIARFGRVDAAVNAAGHYAMVPVPDITPQAWQRMLRVHLGGALHLVRAVLPGMQERGNGSIVLVTSELAIGGGGGDAHYAAAKGGVIGLIRTLGIEVAPSGVRVNGVAPGPTDTPLLAADSPWRDAEYLVTLPAQRLAQAHEIARTVRFLVEEATVCSGEIISPNSGAVI
jgi:2-hydroxycyclohexanecarboxyl-CoA dehydrogenase